VIVSSHIIKTLQERDWIKVVGHKEVPGRPALLATTKAFLDYFNLQSLEQLPPLREVRDLSAAFEQLQGSLAHKAEAESTTAAAQETGHEDESTPVQELSFSHLLAELERMENNLKTDFEDPGIMQDETGSAD
jgi:segregation and condensation protein B